MRHAYVECPDRTRDIRGCRLTPAKIRFCLLALLAFAATTLLAWQSKPFTNDDVLEMVKAGFGVETILEAIRANEPRYDTSAEALKALKNAGASEKIIMGILAAQSRPFTNDDVLEMVKAGFEEETILEAIRTNEPRFDTSAEALKALKNAGASEKIIMDILAEARVRRDASAPSSESDALPAEAGIYVLKDDRYIPLKIELVVWRYGAFGRMSTAQGWPTATLKASMETPESTFRLSGSSEFLLVCPECVEAFEYHLVRAEDNKKKREFRAEFQVLQGGIQVAVAVGGTRKNEVRFEVEKFVAGKFRLKVPELGKGEYAFLPPTKGVAGKLYTFGVR